MSLIPTIISVINKNYLVRYRAYKALVYSNGGKIENEQHTINIFKFISL